IVGEILALAGVVLKVEEQVDGAIADILPAALAHRLLLAVLAVDAPEEAPLPDRRLASQQRQQVDAVQLAVARGRHPAGGEDGRGQVHRERWHLADLARRQMAWPA